LIAPHAPISICGTAVSYDANGNTLSYDVDGAGPVLPRNLIYDGENRPIAVIQNGNVASSAYGPYTTVYNRFNRWRKAGVWDKLMDAIIAAHKARGEKVQMIDSTSVRVHQQAAAQKNRVEIFVSVARVED
jgi:hypothetical protein